MHIYLVAEGLFHKSDSIGYDCVYQYKLLKDYYPAGTDIRIFSRNFDQDRYPGVPIESSKILFELMKQRSDFTLIYHFCDGWIEMDQAIKTFKGRAIVRWHNNTPPWFFTQYSPWSVQRTLNGFQAIRDLSTLGNVEFTCNSHYSKRQLEILGIKNGHLPHVYPASSFLDAIEPAIKQLNQTEAQGISLLFVGRVVAHKGHRHIILIAQSLQKITHRKVTVICPGRHDTGALAYNDELHQLAKDVGVDFILPGEVDLEELHRLYSECTAFVCTSEHEGFGMPVYEAMRMGAPVVAWSATGLKELFDEHPLSQPTLDHDAFARAIASLQDPAVKQQVLGFQQQKILPLYTRKVVQDQLVSAINTQLNAPAGRYHDVPMETPDNFVTLHDLSAYQTLISDGEKFRPGKKKKKKKALFYFLVSSGAAIIAITASWLMLNH